LPIHAKKDKEVPFEVNISVKESGRVQRREKKKKEPFVPADPRCKDCYYWRSAAETTNYFRCCHYALDNGKLRTKISKTECGSFEDRESKPKRKNPFPEVPVSQMGYTPPINWMSQR
jgi:hypothetical protein